MKDKIIFLLILVSLFIPLKITGKTLRDIKNELEAAEKAIQENQNKQNVTEAEMKDIQNRVYNNEVSADELVRKIKVLEDEIEELNNNISLKEEEIKRLINFVQKTEGSNAYLEYIFGAENFADLIYRTAVAEQLSSYNSKLVDEYNSMLLKSEQDKKDMETKKAELVKKRAELEKQYSELSDVLKQTAEAEPSLEEALKLQRETYKFYVDLGCELDDDINTCGKNLLPPTTVLYRPLEIGYFGTAYGPRCYWLNGKYKCDVHGGIDLNKIGMEVPVYAAGVGVVVGTVVQPYAWSCGGQVIFISHNVNGKYYTSVYMHLRKVFVKKGDHVDKNTVIAYMGGSPSIETWDSCSTGQHLHFAISEGMFTTWAKAKANLVNPITVVNFPKLHTTWYDRVTKF